MRNANGYTLTDNKQALCKAHRSFARLLIKIAYQDMDSQFFKPDNPRLELFCGLAGINPETAIKSYRTLYKSIEHRTGKVINQSSSNVFFLPIDNPPTHTPYIKVMHHGEFFGWAYNFFDVAYALYDKANNILHATSTGTKSLGGFSFVLMNGKRAMHEDNCYAVYKGSQLIGIFPTRNDASDAAKVNGKTIVANLRAGTQTRYGYFFRYATDEEAYECHLKTVAKSMLCDRVGRNGGENMKEHPIIFSGESVRSILEGRKSMTRRVVTGNALKMLTTAPADVVARDMPKYALGNRLWVRESYCLCDNGTVHSYKADYPKPNAFWKDGQKDFGRNEDYSWKSSMFMPRKASRITLEVTDIRLEHVQDISEEDALAEGMYGKYEGPNYKYGSKREGVLSQYRRLWDSLNAKRGYPWKSNPRVWGVSFKVIVL